MSFSEIGDKNIFLATSKGLVSWLTVSDVNLIFGRVKVGVEMGGRVNPSKRQYGDLVTFMRKTMSSIFSITC